MNRCGAGSDQRIPPAEATRPPRVAWLVAGLAVVLSGVTTTALLRSWVEGWDYVDPYEKLPVYLAWAVVVALGAALLYVVAWVVLPSLPPCDGEVGPPDVAAPESRRDRLGRGLCVGVACSLLISIMLLGAWRALHPCDPRFGGWCGDPPEEVVPG